MKRNATLLLNLFILLSIVSACGNDQESSKENTTGNSDERLSIHTTVYPLQYFAEVIGGDAVDVSGILSPGSDPHTYEPTTKEMIEMSDADAFIYSGAGLEGYAEQISKAIEPEGVRILEASKGIDLKEHVHIDGGAHTESSHMDDTTDQTNENESHDSHSHNGQDPHVWLDPIRSIQVAENIKAMLIELRPDSKERFQANFQQLKKKLQSLDDDFHDQLESKPKNEIIVSHAAYGYWEQAYGVKQIAIAGLTPTNEPSQKEMESIIEKAEKHDLHFVLFEQNVTPKVAGVVQDEIGAEALRIHNLSVLTEENIQNDEDYFSLMEHNLEILSKALSE